jgi:predicted acetyltransferase
MNNLKLIEPTKERKLEAKEYIQEFRDYNSDINGTGGLHKLVDNYDEWLQKLEKDKDINAIDQDRVPADTYFAVRKEDNKIIGMINIRHELNDYLLKYGGHIGYCVRPTERKKGYATEILSLGLEKCKELGINKVLVTCYKDNIGSAKTIQNNGGVLENEIDSSEEGKIMKKYWIDIK